MGSVITVCWIVFVVYWVVSAIGVKKTVERLGVFDLIKNRLPVILGVLLLFGSKIAIKQHFLFARAVSPDNTLLIIADIFCVIGLAGAIWARRTIGRNWSGDVVFKENHALVEYGPYRWVRHPIYTSMLLMMFGTALAMERVESFIGLILIFVGLQIKLTQEEKLMLKHFPDSYPSYMSRVKRLIPFVY